MKKPYEIFVNFKKAVAIGVMLRDLPGNQCKISLRTDDRRYDASAMCARLGGGGHRAASGGRIEPADYEPPRARRLNAIAPAGAALA